MVRMVKRPMMFSRGQPRPDGSHPLFKPSTSLNCNQSDSRHIFGSYEIFLDAMRPPMTTKWVQLTIKQFALSTLSLSRAMSINLINIKIVFWEKVLGMLTIVPGWEAKTLPLCYAYPPRPRTRMSEFFEEGKNSHLDLDQWPPDEPWPCVWCTPTSGRRSCRTPHTRSSSRSEI